MEYTSSNRIDDFINMQKEQEHTLAAIRECLAKNMPANGKAILFGSQAKGTAREDSDWDILIILDKEELLPADYDNYNLPSHHARLEFRKRDQSCDVFCQGMAKV